jgi:hypothetical protein
MTAVSSGDGEGRAKLISSVATKTLHPNVGEIHPMNSHCSGLDCGALGEVFMTKRHVRKNEAQIDKLESDSGQAGSDSAGQSGDAQGLSQVAEVDEESVGELAERDQAYEAEAVEGVEDAGDHPERPVRTREDKGR